MLSLPASRIGPPLPAVLRELYLSDINNHGSTNWTNMAIGIRSIAAFTETLKFMISSLHISKGLRPKKCQKQMCWEPIACSISSKKIFVSSLLQPKTTNKLTFLFGRVWGKLNEAPECSCKARGNENKRRIDFLFYLFWNECTPSSSFCVDVNLHSRRRWSVETSLL